MRNFFIAMAVIFGYELTGFSLDYLTFPTKTYYQLTYGAVVVYPDNLNYEKIKELSKENK